MKQHKVSVNALHKMQTVQNHIRLKQKYMMIMRSNSTMKLFEVIEYPKMKKQLSTQMLSLLVVDITSDGFDSDENESTCLSKSRRVEF